jgi:hypothetical protein
MSEPSEEERRPAAASLRQRVLNPSSSAFRQSRAEGAQTFNAEQGKHDIEVQSAAHQQNVELRRLDHELVEKRKDNNLRRVCFIAVLVLLAVALVVSGIVGIANNVPGTQQWAQNIVTTILGGLLGAIAGYFAGRSGA